ncbi:MAG: sensor histidine kinase [Bacteroidetes bacterium]|nr:MAG: sensor histidine kinase [Bacteroidota bacterium]
MMKLLSVLLAYFYHLEFRMNTLMKTKSHTASLLMVLSMVVLILFQAYWLRQLYVEERLSLHREASVLLRETMFAEQFRHFYVDTSLKQTRLGGPSSGDTVSFSTQGTITVLRKRDSSADANGLVPAAPSQLLVLADTTEKLMAPKVVMGQPLFKKRHENNADDVEALRVIFSAPGNAMSLKRVDSAYRVALAEAGIGLNYTIKATDLKDALGVKRQNMFATISVAGKQGPMQINTVEVQLLKPEWFLLSKLAVPILFVLVMTGLISSAFWLLHANMRAQRRMAMLKNDFMSNISHELKTPIATVGVALEALKSFDALQNPERTAEYLNIGRKELDRLGLLVDKVLKMSLFEQKQMAMQFEAVDLKTMIEEVLTSMRLLAERANATVSFEAVGSNFVIDGDATHLKSVVYNLLDNALKYSLNQPQITLRLEASPQLLTLTVADRGIGIPLAYHKKVFEKFFRVPQGNTHLVKGYGLGLTYVAAVLRQHQGSIAAAAHPDGGSIFTIQINRGSTFET